MDFWQQTNWFAIQTKPQQEGLAVSHLRRLDLEVFLPRTRPEYLAQGAMRRSVRPLFPGYCFARFCPLLSLEAVQYAHGVLRVVGTRACPIAVAPEIIHSIQDRVRDDGFVWLEIRGFHAGDRVSIEEGPLAGWMGRVERESDDRRRVAILLETIHQTRVVVDGRNLTLVEHA
jgi:transcriptional antiterminator RfaH